MPHTEPDRRFPVNPENSILRSAAVCQAPAAARALAKLLCFRPWCVQPLPALCWALRKSSTMSSMLLAPAILILHERRKFLSVLEIDLELFQYRFRRPRMSALPPMPQNDNCCCWCRVRLTCAPRRALLMPKPKHARIACRSDFSLVGGFTANGSIGQAKGQMKADAVQGKRKQAAQARISRRIIGLRRRSPTGTRRLLPGLLAVAFALKTHKHVPRALSILLLSLTVGFLPKTADGVEIAGDGRIIYRVFEPGTPGNVFLKKEFLFDFAVSNACWEITVKYVKPSNFDDVKAFHCGEETVIVWQIASDTYLQTTAQEHLAGTTNSIVEIHPCPYPPTRMEPLSTVWLAFCSGDYLSTQTGLPPIWIQWAPKLFSANHTVEGRVSWLSKTPPILGDGVFYSDGAKYHVDPQKHRIVKGSRYPSPFDAGFVAATYSVLETIAIDGTVPLPKHFTLKFFRPRQDGTQTNELDLLVEYEGFLERVSQDSVTRSFSPRLKRRSTVLDFRPLLLDPPISSITYQSPGETLIPMEPGFLPHELYLKRVEANPFPMTRQLDRARFIVILSLIIASIVPFVLLYRSKPFGSNLKKEDNL
jgi:hypothetical protein